MKYTIPPHRGCTWMLDPTPELLDERNFQLLADYIRSHGRPRGPLSTLTLDRRVHIDTHTYTVRAE